MMKKGDVALFHRRHNGRIIRVWNLRSFQWNGVDNNNKALCPRLFGSLTDQVKHHRRKGRDHRQEESLDLLLERSDQTLQQALASRSGSPSERASRREQAALLADAVSRLPPDYREVFILRTLEHVQFNEIAD
jgi:RNA polymerase sigma factor (sigma-70 family)